MDNSKDKILEITWKWFEYHASQRMLAFYYFLLIIGALGYGYIYCLGVKNSPYVASFAPIVALFVAIISFAFLCIEIRNLNLVNIGREELIKLGFPPCKKNKDRFSANIDERMFSHSVWLRFIYLSIFFIGLDQSNIIYEIFIKPLGLSWSFQFGYLWRSVVLYLLMPLCLVAPLVFLLPKDLEGRYFFYWFFWACWILVSFFVLACFFVIPGSI